MFRAAKYGKSRIGLLAAMLIFSANTPQAEDRYSENMALLAITLNKERVVAGMMCVGTESSGIDSPSNCEKFDAPDSNVCRPANLGILNPNVLAFDVTSWPRQTIAELASRLQFLADPLNYNFSNARLAGLQVRRIEETEHEESLPPPTFEFTSGCYLLIIAPDSTPALGS
jgi:hypothetical protein